MSTTIPETIPQEVLADPKKLYNFLMEIIEPELMIGVIDTLDEKYAGESEEEKELRYERYELAYSTFDEVLEDIDTSIKDQVEEWKDDIMQKAKAKDEVETKDTLSSLEQSINQAA